MARVYYLHALSSNVRLKFGLSHHSYVSKHCINIRKFCLTACHGKTSTGKARFYPAIISENEYDDDFFGVNASNEKVMKKFQKMSASDKSYVNDLVEKYAIPTGPKNVQLKSFGSIRYDNELPRSGVPQPRLGVVNKQTRQQRRMNRRSQVNQTTLNQTPFILETDISDTENPKMIENNHSLSKSADNEEADASLSFIDKQYFSYDGTVGRNAKQEHSIEIESPNFKGSESSNTLVSENDLSFIDEEYFKYSDSVQTKEKLENCDGPISVGLKKTPEEKNNCTAGKVEVIKEYDEQDLSFVDKQYFSNITRQENVQEEKDRFQSQKDRLQSQDHSERSTNGQRNNTKSIQELYSIFHKKDLTMRENRRSNVSGSRPKQSTDECKNKLEIKKSENFPQEFLENEKKQTAYDASIKIRKELEMKRGSNLVGKFDPQTYDSKGFRILADQVPHFENATSLDVLSILRKSIIYDKNDIVAISKPYGLPSHDGPGVFHSVGKFIDKLIPRAQLYPVHRLDKETTGVMLFAKTEEMANRLSECFFHREVKKKYLVITKNIPEMSSGEIDIPIAEGTVEGKVRMCLRPYNSPELNVISKKRQHGIEAITKYKVLDQGKKCALLECFPVTGKKHQIRAHLALGLNCPILGDHKYSHMNKIAPMKLHPEILDSLKIQQSKVRYLAMHLHARSIMIPEFLNGRNLFISAPLPPHFVRNLKDLKLKLPPHS